MTRRDDAGLLWHIVEHGRLAVGFLRNRTFDDYATNPMLRSAVERQVIIVGEATGRLDESLASRLTDSPHEVVAMRNILMHGYDVIADERVYDAVVTKPPRWAPLDRALTRLEYGGRASRSLDRGHPPNTALARPPRRTAPAVWLDEGPIITAPSMSESERWRTIR